MAADFNAVLNWMLSAVVTLWTFFSGALGFWFWLIVSVGVARRVLRLIHKLFSSST